MCKKPKYAPILLLVSALLLVAVGMAASAYAQTPPMVTGPRVNVSEASFKLVVYPDGAVEPVYRLVASADLGVKADGKAVFETYSSYTGTESETRAGLRASFRGIEEDSSFKLHVEARGGYSFGGGDGQLNLYARIDYSGEDESYNVELRNLTVVLSGGREVTLIPELIDLRSKDVET
jgi:hypothetical protein